VRLEEVGEAFDMTIEHEDVDTVSGLILVVRDWLEAAYEKGFRELRVIHGRGIGVQRQTVRSLLERDPRVESFGDAPAEAGGWGATWVRMR
jgi:dsDNA-specific endonuclease/ATPase MutS2